MEGERFRAAGRICDKPVRSLPKSSFHFLY
jgi:hypothetical protein